MYETSDVIAAYFLQVEEHDRYIWIHIQYHQTFIDIAFTLGRES